MNASSCEATSWSREQESLNLATSLVNLSARNGEILSQFYCWRWLFHAWNASMKSLCVVQEIGDLRDSLNSEVERLKTVGLLDSVEVMNDHTVDNGCYDFLFHGIWKAYEAMPKVLNWKHHISSLLLHRHVALVEDVFVHRLSHFFVCCVFIGAHSLYNIHCKMNSPLCSLQEFRKLRSTVSDQMQKATSKLAELVCVQTLFQFLHNS